MRDKPGNPMPHPDDYMVVTLTIEFRAKLNPEVEDPLPFEMTELEYTPPTDEAAAYLEEVINAIRQRRLYGFMVQEIAESAVSAGDWIEKTTAEVIAEAGAHGEEQTTEKRSPNETD
jgi:DMSO/TMAO reductase YedYZ molybdopterin-dependent catalytic subunit